MKKKIVILSVLSLMPSLGATESMLVAPGSANMEPQYQWYDVPMIKAQEEFRRYYDFIAENGPNIETVSMTYLSNLQKAIKNILDEIPLAINMIVDLKTQEKRFDILVGAYCYLVGEASSNLKDLAQYNSYLSDIGTFIGKMTSRMTNEVGSLDSLNIKTEVALRNDGYKREYFLGEVIDNEKKDGIRYYFYSEPTKRPAMWRSLLGFGYTDKRGWFKYAFDKVKYPAVFGGLAYAGYRNKEKLKSAGEFVGRHAKKAGRYLRSKYNDVTGKTARQEEARRRGTFWGLDLGKRTRDLGSSISNTVSDFTYAPTTLLKQAGDAIKNSSISNTVRDFTYAPRTLFKQADDAAKNRENKFNQRYEAIKNLKQQEKQALFDLNKQPLVEGERPTWRKGTPGFEARKEKERAIKAKFAEKRKAIRGISKTGMITSDFTETPRIDL